MACLPAGEWEPNLLDSKSIALQLTELRMVERGWYRDHVAQAWRHPSGGVVSYEVLERRVEQLEES